MAIIHFWQMKKIFLTDEQIEKMFGSGNEASVNMDDFVVSFPEIEKIGEALTQFLETPPEKLYEQKLDNEAFYMKYRYVIT